MALTEKEKAEKWEKMQEINKRSFAKRQAKIKLLLAKAEKANITVSDAEVEVELKRLAKLGK
jgi:hypothetical protein